MIPTFRTGDSLKARAARLDQLRKLANQADALREIHIDASRDNQTEQWDALADEAQAVATYAYGYADALHDDPQAAIYLRSVLPREGDVHGADSYSVESRECADLYTDIARLHRERSTTAA